MYSKRIKDLESEGLSRSEAEAIIANEEAQIELDICSNSELIDAPEHSEVKHGT